MTERDLMDYQCTDGAERPWQNDFDHLNSSWFIPSIEVPTGIQLNSLCNSIKLKFKNFFARAYVTAEKAGNSYDTRFGFLKTLTRYSLV